MADPKQEFAKSMAELSTTLVDAYRAYGEAVTSLTATALEAGVSEEDATAIVIGEASQMQYCLTKLQQEFEG